MKNLSNQLGPAYCSSRKIRLKKKEKSIVKVRGIGVNDLKGTGRTPAYVAWINMLQRIVNDPSYRNVQLKSEWRTFSNFKAWYERQVERLRAAGYEGEYALDKDLLAIDGLMYGPDTCCLIPSSLNSYLSKLGQGGVNQLSEHCYRVSLGNDESGKRTRAHFNTYDEAYTARAIYLSGQISKLYDELLPVLKVQACGLAVARLCTVEGFIAADTVAAMVNDAELQYQSTCSYYK